MDETAINDENDYYDVLGIGPESSSEEVQHAYRDQVKQWHPDLFRDAPQDQQTEAEQTMRQITEAYGILGDPEKRLHYDTLHQNRIPEPMKMPTGGVWVPGRQMPGYSATHGTQDGAGTFFALILGIISVTSLLRSTSIIDNVPLSVFFGIVAIVTGLLAVTLFLRQ